MQGMQKPGGHFVLDESFILFRYFPFLQVYMNLAQPLKENQFGLFGELNLVELTGALTPLSPSTPVRCVLCSAECAVLC